MAKLLHSNACFVLSPLFTVTLVTGQKMLRDTFGNYSGNEALWHLPPLAYSPPPPKKYDQSIAAQYSVWAAISICIFKNLQQVLIQKRRPTCSLLGRFEFAVIGLNGCMLSK